MCAILTRSISSLVEEVVDVREAAVGGMAEAVAILVFGINL